MDNAIDERQQDKGDGEPDQHLLRDLQHIRRRGEGNLGGDEHCE
jgi:hypothetical protein